MNKKGYGKRVLYIDLDWINKKGFNKRVAMVVRWPRWMNIKGFNKRVMVVELRDSMCVLFFSVHPFVLSFFLSCVGLSCNPRY